MGALTFAIDNTRSMYKDSTNNLAMLTDQDAMVQACTQRLSHLVGEFMFAKKDGIDYMGTVFAEGVSQLPTLQKNMIARLKSMTHVLDVPYLRVTWEQNTLKFVAQVLTEFGTINLKG